jgi:type IV pilus assembly protein PilM
MHTFPVCWGLDVGHATIKAVKLARQGTKVSVLGYAIEPITVPEGGDREESVVAALKTMALREEFKDTPVLAALSGRQVFSKTVNIPILNPKNIERMIELEAQQQIPGDFSEIEWGYHMSPAADGASKDVALFAVKRELTQEVMIKCRRAGVNLVGISISSLALYNFVRFDQVFPEDETVVILDVGAENTDLVCYQGETLWMRTLGVAGNDITKAFMKKFKVSFDEAEILKRQAGDSKQADRIIKVIEGSLTELTSEVQRSLGFYKSQNAAAKLDNLVISGSTFRLPGLPEYMAERLRYTVNILEDLDKIQVAAGLERDHFMHDLQSLGVAMGLALQGTGVARANVDLMPSSQQLQRVLATKRWAGLAIVAAIGATLVLDHMVVGGVADENVRLIKKIKDSYSQNNVRQQASREALSEVAPKATDLKSFEVYGTQQGVTAGIYHALLSAVVSINQARGTVAGPLDATGEKSAAKPTPLQSMYLRSVTLPPFASDGASGPFRPLATTRKVILVISIPVVASPGEGTRQLLDVLKALPVPETLAAAHPDMAAFRAWQAKNPSAAADEVAKHQPKLFSDVQAISDSAGEESYFFIDKSATDARGDLAPVEEERKAPAKLVTLACTLKGQEAAP